MNEMSVSQNGGLAVAAGPRNNLWFTPRFDVFENDDEYTLVGDLPGVEPRDLEVTYENQELSIYGKVAPRQPGTRCFAEEYGVGDFRRTFAIGEDVDRAAIGADLKDGVLTIRLPKRPESKPRRIAVKAG